MNRLCIAVVCLALNVPLSHGQTPPTSRPVNFVQSPNGFAVVDGTTIDEFGGSFYPVWAAPLPADHLNGVAVTDYLRKLQDNIPHFRFIVRRDGVGDNYVVRLPTMDTSNLTLGEFVNFVNRNCAGVQIEPDKSVSDRNPLYIVTLSAPPAAPTTAPAPAVDPPVVQTFSLSDAIGVQQLAHKENEVRALNDVLSLIQAVVDASPDGRSAKLKVHAPTGMLIFIGPHALGQAIAGTLNTLERNDQGGLHTMVNDALRQSNELQQKIDDLQADNAKLRESAAAATRPAAK